MMGRTNKEIEPLSARELLEDDKEQEVLLEISQLVRLASILGMLAWPPLTLWIGVSSASPSVLWRTSASCGTTDGRSKGVRVARVEQQVRVEHIQQCGQPRKERNPHGYCRQLNKCRIACSLSLRLLPSHVGENPGRSNLGIFVVRAISLMWRLTATEAIGSVRRAILPG